VYIRGLSDVDSSSTARGRHKSMHNALLDEQEGGTYTREIPIGGARVLHSNGDICERE
jgi:hypothetical protein